MGWNPLQVAALELGKWIPPRTEVAALDAYLNADGSLVAILDDLPPDS
jgi:hypothetical protein